MKCKLPRPKFELVSSDPLLIKITITPRAPPPDYHRYVNLKIVIEVFYLVFLTLQKICPKQPISLSFLYFVFVSTDSNCQTPTRSDALCLFKETGAYPVIPPKCLMWHFRQGICVLFTLGNRCISCYAVDTTYVAFLLGYPSSVYFRKQVHILLCQSCYLCGTSKKSSAQFPTVSYERLYRVFQSKTNNLHRVVWFQVFLSISNIIWFQVIISIK